MPPRRKLCYRQLEMLVEFAESHSDVSLGRFSGGPLANQAAKQAWDNIALKLNASADGVSKTPEQWRRYWIEYKAKVKAKAADVRRNASATGGGPCKLVPLTELEERVLALIGPVAVEGLRGVSIPLEVELHTPMQPWPHSPQEWREEICYSPLPTTPPPGLQDPLPGCSGVQMGVNEGYSGEHSYHRSLPRELPRPNPIIIPNAQPRQDNQQSTVDTESPRPSPVSRNAPPRQEGNERVPRWAYDMETRRLNVEERIATSLETLIAVITDFRNDIRELIARRN